MTNKSDYFSPNYAQARERFCEAAGALNGVGSREFLYDSAKYGHYLKTDMVWQGPRDARAVLLVTTGLHGVEGFAGSAIQLQALTEKYMERLAPGMAVVHVHALNPYGFAHQRRVDDNNVDLNRNFIDWSAERPKEHPLTAKVQAALMPRNWNWPLVLGRTLSYAVRRDLDFKRGWGDLQDSLQGGQYSIPQGLFYGGNREAWTNAVVRHVIDECTEKAEMLVHLDVHTGLGRRGDMEMIVAESWETPMSARARLLWGSTVKSTASKDSVSSDVSGSIDFAFSEAVRRKCDITTACMEFGTLDKISVVKALAYENWVYARGKGESFRQKARAEMRRAFAPHDPAWQEDVLFSGKIALIETQRKMEKRLAELSAADSPR